MLPLQPERTQLDTQLREILGDIATEGIAVGGGTPQARHVVDQAPSFVQSLSSSALVTVEKMAQLLHGAGVPQDDAIARALDAAMTVTVVTALQVGYEFHRRGFVLPVAEEVVG